MLNAKQRAPKANIEVHDGIAFVAAGDFLLTVYALPARAHRLRWMFDRADAYLAAFSGSVLGLQVILPEATPPDAAGRAENARRLPLIDPRFRRVVTVPLGDDITQMLIRTVMRAMFAMRQTRNSRSVAQSIPQSLDLLLAAASENTPSRAEINVMLGNTVQKLNVDPAAIARWITPP